MSQPRIEIISGPTCAGKSVYIDKCCAGHDGLLFLGRADLSTLRPQGRYLVHYNLLRPFDVPRVRLTRFKTYWRTAGFHLNRLAHLGKTPFEADPPLMSLLRQPAAFHVTVLVAPLANLLARVNGRSALEPLLDEVRGKRYETNRWRRVYNAIDLGAVYQQWLDFLRGRGIDYTLIDSSGGEYPALADLTEMMRIVHDRSPANR